MRSPGPAHGSPGLVKPYGPAEVDSCRNTEELRDAVTVCFQYLVPQVTVSDYSTCYSELAQLHSELGVAVRNLPLSCGP